MKKISIYTIAAMLFLATGCRKDSTIDGMLIVSEGMRGDSKAMVDDLTLNWVAGESIRINGEDMNIVVNGENQAYLENVPTSNVYRALYPATLNSSASLDDDNVTVTIPDTYTYIVNDGKQVLEVPMAARSIDGNRLYFKHLTAAITVEITNYYGFAVLVDSVVVTSSDAGTEHQISGVTSINLADANMGITTNSNPTVAQKKVKMLFGDGTHAMKIDQGATKKVQVPVLPVGNGNKFSISVTVHKDGDAAVTKTFTKTQGHGGAMGRAKMAYADHTVGFLFSIGRNKKVIISQGNLQYQASTGTWRFAEHQYDYIGATKGNTTPAADRATQSAWIDLFGWGTSGWNNGNTYFQPYNTTVGGKAYGPTEGNLTDGNANADWGVYNAISNGGNLANLWRTLTKDEWNYVLNTRSASTVNGTANARYAKAAVANVQGLILFPDSYTHPVGVDLPTNINNNNNGNDFTVSDFALMEANGAVFLPCAGIRYGVTLSYVGAYGGYWSSTKGGNGGVAQCLCFRYDSQYNFLYIVPEERQNGSLVRLVRDVK